KIDDMLSSPYRVGQSSPQVKMLKLDLAKLGFIVSSNPNNDYGPQTERVVREFQKHYGLRVNGIADEVTLEKIATELKNKVRTVFIDPGHGGSDPGAVAGGYKEKDINLSVAKKVQSILKQRGYDVIMSRSDDTTVGLYDRPQMANNLSNVDIFVSIHSNANGNSSVNGIESYYYKYKPEYPPTINENMHNNPQRIERSVTLTQLIHNKMLSYTNANNRGTNGASFVVVRETRIPATLLELGYITNASERSKLVTASYQEKLAKAIADGIEEYFQFYD
ncbi:N-acetylmuramoyl-L-alanine amidase, partial [Pallidibacillus thermolactis]|uniref:N-acetylmuramoyl-L-alanine amidase n=1 Tax=Pallidibacillus thermolactis TaxID=251051 RepID=UPI002E1BD346